MDKQKNDESPIRVYGTKWYVKLTMTTIIAFYVFMILLAKELRFFGFNQMWPIYFLFAIFAAILFFYEGTQTIAVYENGIEHRYAARKTFATWEELSHFSTVRNRPSITTVRWPEIQINHQWLNRVFPKPHGSFVLVPTECGVPSKYDAAISGFQVDIEKLLKTDFGRDLLYYAPHLFKDSNHETQKNQ